ncbi:unnamed protein product [Heligmosomoides polygyrus]|uniref:Col_cuticle_N domain-containing protein n=1 Tax=Heligmosomoides polygyrus TaxID=6339 RepID=A0A3P8CJW7_HELPZ|nr:unnamed protein product [Heligmosomoides polygyrus]
MFTTSSLVIPINFTLTICGIASLCLACSVFDFIVMREMYYTVPDNNVKEIKYLTTDVIESGSIKINETELARTSVSKYLGSAIASVHGLMAEVNPRVCCLVQVTFADWRALL